ncbi:MAG: cell division/cell wall cluster transcriptional repressor MraZ [Candidatus Portnoybacteria bacterium RIFCSPLOWO2_01_FULL_43_11]|uniref:Transcriptional regulator MraZ n=3 Tax=Candidatus Portnoyibacteriota TaxID=1817913 RepID=A0A1G2FCH2_9BACT|nr:MAG: cell division/cell wall cluster transcriptional repressor MraZ [Candidatus Portnoybacteria bacterium RIFCSPHIGHO2_01_FULL_40_12b]OGZ37309.1 MAG: cell division/cell wall cluster transcriptional repressor MraZ [Candidatus Portnoybacteria bacterium RIFCSPHIGHO2_02_FULL_40_23]OGZ38472.1 MAG: cell division/cell wall cluster transcriptional repressor MraZ [Candidatus Portnoybacteria bacterium RIFCSPLOWO2_01_FULL_43_11]OGZ38601.1 MAG: cell division/cell wall cluster transcriptional repressor Mr
MFIGEYAHSIDNKKRLAIPSKFRKELGPKAVITRGLDQCLVIYPLKEWNLLADKIGKLPISQMEARGFTRIMLAGAMDAELDKLGRILIPDYLKKYANLKKNVIITGLYNRLEIWDKDKWNAYRVKMEKEMGDSVSKLGELGI